MVKKGYVKADEIQIKGDEIFSPMRCKWLLLTPEERVRQEYLFVLTEGNVGSGLEIWERVNHIGSNCLECHCQYFKT